MEDRRAALSARLKIPAGHDLVRTYKPRRGRVTDSQGAALARCWPRLGVRIPFDEGAARCLDLALLFGRRAPVVLEIGSGMGEVTAAMAEADPARDVLAVDVHTPGLGNLIKLVEAAGLPNVRVAEGDALVLLRAMLGPGSLDEVRVFFPDPWPKARHAKRRLVTSAFADLAASRLTPGGRVHIATDWGPYADTARSVLGDHPEFAVLDGGLSPRPGHRPVTRFERQALAAGRQVFDVLAVRRTGELAGNRCPPDVSSGSEPGR